MENNLTTSTIDYVEGLQQELRKLSRIVRKGIYKFTSKSIDKADEVTRLLEKYNVPYRREDIQRVDIILITVDSTIAYENIEVE